MTAYLKHKFGELVRLSPSSERETSRLPSAPPTDAAAVNHGTSVCASDSDLWKLAYERLQSDESLKSVIEQYKTILRDVVEEAKKDLSESKVLNAQGLPEEMVLVVQSKIDIMNTKQWKFQWRGKTLAVRNEVNRLVKVIKAISDPASAAASFNPYASLAWGGVCFLLPLILNDSDQLTLALEGIKTITDLIDQYRIIENVYVGYTHPTEKGGLGDAMVSLYQSILAYQAKAACYYSLKTTNRAFRNIVKKEDWLGMAGDIKDRNQTCRNIMRDTEFKVMQAALNKHTQMLEDILKNAQQHDTENERIPTWISSFPVESEHDDVRNNSLGSRYWSSGTWLLENETFLQWQASTSGTFWLRGPVGTGKTCAVCIAIEHLFKTATSARIAFFYCSKTRHSAESNDPKVVLGSLLAQLSYSAAGESIHPPIRAKYDNDKERRGNGAKLSQKEYTDLLIEVTKLNKQTIVVIDALDEGPNGQSFELLSSLQLISNESPAVKFFFSSRMEVRVNQHFQNTMDLTVIGQENSQDIKLFIIGEFFAPRRHVTDEVKATIRDQYGCQFPSILYPDGTATDGLKSGMTSEQGSRLIKALMNRAHGMFRWVELQLDIFLKPDKPIYIKEDFEEKLCALELDSPSELPDLDKAYDQTFNSNIPPADQKHAREYAVRALKWTLCSQRPLTLEELAYAISDDGSAKPLSEDVILQHCSNFIIKDNQGCVQHAHFSVTQYLEQRGLEFSRPTAHILAATTCLSYFNRPDSDLSGIFGRYATLYWPLHYQNISGNQSGMLEDGLNIKRDQLRGLEEKTEQFLYGSRDSSLSFMRWTSAASQSCKFLDWDKRQLRESLGSVSSTPPTPLFLACCFSMMPILEHLSTFDNIDWNQRNTEDNSALYLAAVNGHEAVVQLLLEKGADINARDKRGRTALHNAARFGDKAAVRLLLDKGSDINARDTCNKTALHDVAEFGNEAVVRLLLENGFDINARDKWGETALHNAARSRDKAVVRLLLGKEFDINVRNEWGRTALHNAAGSRDEAVVRLLLEKGFDITTRDIYNKTVLHDAAGSGDEAVVRLLLESGSDINARDKWGGTALHDAAKSGHKAVVRLLQTFLT